MECAPYMCMQPPPVCGATTEQEDISFFTCMSIIFMFCSVFYIAVCLLLLSLFSQGNLYLSPDMSSLLFLFQQRPGRGLVHCLSKQETAAPNWPWNWWKRQQGTLFSECLPLGPACISSPCLISFQLECKTDSCIAK